MVEQFYIWEFREIARRLNGLGVWFSLWVREVPGSNPGWAHLFVQSLKALDDSDKIWQAEIEQKAQTSFQNIQNCNDYKDGSDHYNFKFALRACNYEADGESYEISECPQDGVERICSDTTVEDAEQLIGEVGKGNSYLQIPVRDLNENTPVFSDTYDTPIYQVFEHIQEK